MSRKLSDLQKPFREQAILFAKTCNEKGLQILIYCTSRTFEEQARLYRNGRSLIDIKRKAYSLENKYHRSDLASILMNVGPQNGKDIVTYAAPGQSLHNYNLAFDGCPMKNGKPVWGTRQSDDLDLWFHYGEIAESLGLEWAGSWSVAKREFPHIQKNDAEWRELIKG